MKLLTMAAMLLSLANLTLGIPDLSQIQHPEGKKALNWPPPKPSAVSIVRSA